MKRTNAIGDHKPATNETTSEMPRIEPLFNSAFARIFGTEESKPLTRGLVNAVLSRVGLEPVEQIEWIDAEHTATVGTVECKTPRMDVRIVAAGRVVDLEAQGYPEDVDNRSLFYAAQLLCENTPAGTNYKDLPQVVVITLLDAPSLFPDAQGFVHSCRMRWNVDGGNAAEGTDRMLSVVVELEKVRTRYNRLTDEVLSDELLSWVYLLTKGYVDDTEVQRIMSEVPSIEYFAELYGRAVDDPKVKRAFEDAVSAEREYQSRQDYYERLKREAIDEGLREGREKGLEEGLEEGRKEGLEEGRKEGRKEGIDSAAEKMREMGIDEDIIEKVVASALSTS